MGLLGWLTGTDDHAPPGSDDAVCPACGEEIAATAVYCMHCKADLSDPRAAADDVAVEPPVDRTAGARSDRAGIGAQLGTTAVAVVMAPVLAFVVFLATLVPAQEFSLLFALLALVGGAVVVARQRALGAAIGTGLVLLAVPVFLFPVGLGVPAATRGLLAGDVGRFVEQLGVGLFGSLLTLPVSGTLAVAGFVLRRRAD